MLQGSGTAPRGDGRRVTWLCSGRVARIQRQWRFSGGPDTDRYWLIRHGGKSTGKGLKGWGVAGVGHWRGFHQRGLAKKL